MGEISHNIIGDIHGRSVWKELVDENLVNVFVGDFFDPYTYDITFEECRYNFMEIVDYKRQHPETVLLWGNHELHYLLQGELDETYSRFDYLHSEAIQKILEWNRGYFSGVAYSVGDEYLVTHAGVSRYWYMRWIEKYEGQSPDYVAEQLNNLWNINPRAFSVHDNKRYPYDDDGSTQSPLWMRPEELAKFNLFDGTGFRQVYGHTQCDRIEECNGLICVDCLRMASRGEGWQPLTLKI